MWRAAVPPLHARACFVPTNDANSFSRVFISGAYNPSSAPSAQRGPSSSTLITAFLSASMTMGHFTFCVTSAAGWPPRMASVSCVIGSGSVPGFHAFVDEPTQLASRPQRARRGCAEAEFKQAELVVPPRVGEARLDPVLDGGADARFGRAVDELDAEFDRVAIAGAQDADLPVAGDARQIVEQLLEEPRTEVAHAAVHHLVGPAANLRDPAHELQRARARLVDERRDVGGPVSNQGHDAPRE